MNTRLPLLLGLGLGYVLGSRAGRGHYDKLSDGVNKMWNDPRVQDKVVTAKEKAPVIANKLTDQAKTAADTAKNKVTGAEGTSKVDTLKDDALTYGETTPAGMVGDPASAGVTSDNWAKTEDTWRNDNTGL